MDEDRAEDQEFNHLLVMVDLQMEDLQIVAEEAVLRGAVALHPAAAPVAEEAAAMAGAKVLLHAAEALREMDGVKKPVLLHAAEAPAKEPKEK